MTSPQREELEKLAIEYAKDFQIPYDKLHIRKNGITFHIDSDEFGTGYPSQGVSYKMLHRYFELKAQTQKDTITRVLSKLPKKKKPGHIGMNRLHSVYGWNEAIGEVTQVLTKELEQFNG
jgi:hypothetical protein